MVPLSRPDLWHDPSRFGKKREGTPMNTLRRRAVGILLIIAAAAVLAVG
jgi:hypothetical protein